MKQRKNIYEVLDEIERGCKTPVDLRWIKKLKAKTKKEEKVLNKMTKKQLIEKLKGDLIKLDNSLYEDLIFIDKLKQKINARRKAS